ncbi:MAG: hypothetical protein JWP54_675 [Cryobacterium sp.]|nr:hypothetical protein [Cryobacterium sp.]
MTPPTDAGSHRLTQPTGLDDLQERFITGGRVTVTGRATYRGVRVGIKGVSPRNPSVEIYGPITLPDLLWRQDDVQSGFTSGDVAFSSLQRFWLTRTSTYDAVDEYTPRPGVLAVVDGDEYGVTDTCGTVSAAGIPELQVISLAEGAPEGADWVRDGYGQWTRFVARDRVTSVRQVEWTAVWRDLTVLVADISGEQALVFAERGGVPDYIPEITHGSNVHGGWSAVVPVEQLSLRSWTSTERPLGAGCVGGNVGLVRGRTVLVARADTAKAGETGVVAQKRRGETVTGEFSVDLWTGRADSGWEWRVDVDVADLADIRHIETTTEWKGETRTVAAIQESEDLIYLERETVDLREVSPLVHAATAVEPGELPTVDILW